MLVYLDTSALGHLADRVGVTDADEQTLRTATGSHALTIALSAVTIDEVLALANSSHDKAARLLRLMLELFDCTRLIKPPAVLLTEQVGAYARGENAPDLYFHMEQEHLSALEGLALEARRPSPAVVEIARQVEAQKDDFQARLEPGYSEFQVARKALARENPHEKMPTFERYWTDNERGIP